MVTLDYRGFGDSVWSGLITVDTVVTDVESVLAWLRENRQVSSPILVWGHSLGSAVASSLLSLLRHEGSQPAGLVLESPFNNMTDMVRNHKRWNKIPYFVWRKMPWFDWFFNSNVADNDVAFKTDQRIAMITCPVLILHAEDDTTVPFKLGVALYEAALQSRDETEVEFIRFPSELHYGHKDICRAPDLPDIFRWKNLYLK